MSDTWERGPPPKDGSEIMVPIHGQLRIYWNDEQQAWVLTTPLNMEALTDEPYVWRLA